MIILGTTFATIICHFDDMSLSLNGLDCLQIDSYGILFAEINQILLKISFISIFLTFVYLVAIYQKTEL